MKFKAGESGNPNGRAKGTLNKNTKLAHLLMPHAEDIIYKLVELAKNGDVNAIKLCIERMVPKVKEAHVIIELPKFDFYSIENLTQIGGAILEAVANGKITPNEGQSITNIISTNCKMIETYELCSRVAEIEHQLKKRDDRVKKGVKNDE